MLTDKIAQFLLLILSSMSSKEKNNSVFNLKSNDNCLFGKKVEKYRPRRNNYNNSVQSNFQKVSDNYTSCPFQDGFLTLLIPEIFMHKSFHSLC